MNVREAAVYAVEECLVQLELTDPGDWGPGELEALRAELGAALVWLERPASVEVLFCPAHGEVASYGHDRCEIVRLRDE